MRSLFPIVTLVALAASASLESDMTCRKQGNQICCQADISVPGKTYASNVCCDGTVSGKSDQSDPPSLLNAFRGMVCCEGSNEKRRGNDYGKKAATACDEGVKLVQMTDVAKQAGVTQQPITATSTMSGPAGMPTANSGMGMVLAAAGVVAML